jgi:hypothetical protein
LAVFKEDGVYDVIISPRFYESLQNLNLNFFLRRRRKFGGGVVLDFREGDPPSLLHHPLVVLEMLSLGDIPMRSDDFRVVVSVDRTILKLVTDFW